MGFSIRLLGENARWMAAEVSAAGLLLTAKTLGTVSVMMNNESFY